MSEEWHSIEDRRRMEIAYILIKKVMLGFFIEINYPAKTSQEPQEPDRPTYSKAPRDFYFLQSRSVFTHGDDLISGICPFLEQNGE